MDALERKVWKMWKSKYTLYRMAREISNITNWSEYLSLCFIVNFLHNKKGVGFSRKQLEYAFSKIPREDVEGARKEAWEWLLHLGGFKFERGRKPSQGVAKNTHILWSLRRKIAVE